MELGQEEQVPSPARSPPQLEISVALSLSRSGMVTMEKGILLPRVPQEHSKGWDQHSSFPKARETPGRSRSCT